jgi:hypothetical protein
MTIGPVIGGTRGPPNLTVSDRSAQRTAKHARAPAARADQRDELVAVGSSALVQRP